MTLGSIINSYNYRKSATKRSKLMGTDINDIVERLEGYDRYKKQLSREKYSEKRKKENKAKALLRKALYKKIYSVKTIRPNPYISFYNSMMVNPDPKLIERYKSENMFSMFEFRHVLLPKSKYTLTANQAWKGLIKAWQGYKITTDARFINPNLHIRYAPAVQKFATMLEVPMIPDFSPIGLSREGINHAKILREYFEGYEKELG